MAASPASLRISVMRELLDVVNQAEELPLRIDLDAPAQREAVEPFVVAQVAEHRLDGGEAAAVGDTTFGGIDALSHARGQRVLGFCVFEEGDLSRLGGLGFAQTLVS